MKRLIIAVILTSAALLTACGGETGATPQSASLSEAQSAAQAQETSEPAPESAPQASSEPTAETPDSGKNPETVPGYIPDELPEPDEKPEPDAFGYMPGDRSAFHKYLRENLDKDSHAYFNTITTGRTPVIGYVAGRRADIEAVIAAYEGTVIEPEWVECSYSLSQLEAFLAEIRQLPCVEEDYAKPRRTIGSLSVYDGKVQFIIYAPMPELEAALESYPAEAINIQLFSGDNPDT